MPSETIILIDLSTVQDIVALSLSQNKQHFAIGFYFSPSNSLQKVLNANCILDKLYNRKTGYSSNFFSGGVMIHNLNGPSQEI